MSHPQREWFIGDFNESAYQFISSEGNIEGFDFNTDFILGAQVNIKGILVGKNLARMPSYRAISVLKEHRRRFRLKFEVYVRDTPGAIIVPWVGDIKKPVKIKAKKKIKVV